MVREMPQYSRVMTPAFFANANNEDLKWTINYLVGLLEKSEPAHNLQPVKTLVEAKQILSARKLRNRNVPTNFNGMRDEANPKYL